MHWPKYDAHEQVKMRCAYGSQNKMRTRNYVCVATSKSEVRLTSCPLVQSLSVFLVLKVAGPTGGQIRWPHLRSDWRPR